jgi:hypothetical protein
MVPAAASSSQIELQCWLVQRLDIRLLADPVAAPLSATVGTGDQFTAVALLNVLGEADEARSSAPSKAVEYRGPPIKYEIETSREVTCGKSQGHAIYPEFPAIAGREPPCDGCSVDITIIIPDAFCDLHQ